jgi:hypothetical protein
VAETLKLQRKYERIGYQSKKRAQSCGVKEDKKKN